MMRSRSASTAGLPEMHVKCVPYAASWLSPRDFLRVFVDQGVHEGDNGLERGCSKTCSVLPKALRRPHYRCQTSNRRWLAGLHSACASALLTLDTAVPHLTPSTTSISINPSSILSFADMSQAQERVCETPNRRHDLRRESRPG